MQICSAPCCIWILRQRGIGSPRALEPAEGRRRGLAIEIAWFELLLSVSGPESAFADTVMVGAATSVGPSTYVPCTYCVHRPRTNRMSAQVCL
jgi:hypothetical protein